MVQAETRVISAFKELVVKLNEAAFRPLFRRLYDWAFTSDSGAFVVLIILYSRANLINLYSV
jgi:U3 small nucleolar RNA-associated protein 10